MDNAFKVQATLDALAAARAKTSDANHFLYLVKANQLADADSSKIKKPVLLLYSPTDLVFQAPLVEAAAKQIAAAGTPIETGKLIGPYGHLNGVLAIAQAADQIRSFMDK
jgi:homoserine O-acetyltransferase